MRLVRDKNSYRALVDALTRGGVVIMACDTIYGIVGRVPDTEERIRRIKGRDGNQPFLMLLSEAAEVSQLGISAMKSPLLSLWPGPFTFIFPTVTGGTTACRVPEDARLRSLIREVGRPLYSTSVNRAGRPHMNDPLSIHAEFEGEVSLLEDSGILSNRLPSTLIDLTCRPPQILRQGSGIVPKELLKGTSKKQL